MSAEEYQARAELADRQARAARNAEERSTFLEIAKLWRDMAARAPLSGKEPQSVSLR